MFSSTSGRKPLLRNGYERPSMKNWPLFAFLFGLVFFFYIFYVYQIQSTEFALNREQLEIQLQQVKALKNELIDVKAELERIGLSEAAIKKQNSDYSTKLDECTTSLRASKIKTESMLLEKTKCEKSLKDQELVILDLKNNITELERNNTAQRMLISTQDVLSNQLNQTVQALKTEVSAFKNGLNLSQQQLQHSKEVTLRNNKVSEEVSIAAIGESPQQIEGQATKSETSDDSKITGGLKQDGNGIEAPDLLQNAMDINYKKEEQRIQLPNSPGDRVKLEVERGLQDEKGDNRPIVKGGDYDNKHNEADKDDVDGQSAVV